MRKFLFIILSALACGLLLAAAPNGLTNRNVARIAASVPTGGGVELIVNGGFEDFTGTQDDGTIDAFTGWTVTANQGNVNLVEASATANSGSNGLKITRSVGSVGVAQSFAVTPGANYVCSFYSQGDGTNALRYNIFDETNAASIVGPVLAANTAASWAQEVVPFTAPVGCISVSFNTNQLVNGSVVRLDDVSAQVAP